MCERPPRFASPGLNYPTELTSLADGGLKGPCSKVCYRGRGRVSRDWLRKSLSWGLPEGFWYVTEKSVPVIVTTMLVPSLLMFSGSPIIPT